MAYGVPGLAKIQIGKETTAGTAVAATTIWRGPFAPIVDGREIQQAEENIGQLVPKARTYVPRKVATLEMPETEATFEQLPYILAAGVENVVTGVADGTGSGKVYQYDLSNAAQQTPAVYTIESGDNVRVDEMEYSFVEEFELNGNKGEAVKMSGKWKGRQSTDAEHTTSLSVPTVEEILFGSGKLYIDDSAGTVGTTQKTGTWLGFKLSCKTGHKVVESADGQVYFATITQSAPEITGEILLEHDAIGEAELNKARTEAARLVRMTFEGSNLTTASTYSKKTLRIDMAILYTEVPSIDEQDADDVVALPFRVVDDTSLQATFTVVNSLTALT